MNMLHIVKDALMRKVISESDAFWLYPISQYATYMPINRSWRRHLKGGMYASHEMGITKRSG
jgi:hypothetical protein